MDAFASACVINLFHKFQLNKGVCLYGKFDYSHYNWYRIEFVAFGWFGISLCSRCKSIEKIYQLGQNPKGQVSQFDKGV